nr:hypothetical protein [Microbacterium sp. USTB-Y]
MPGSISPAQPSRAAASTVATMTVSTATGPRRSVTRPETMLPTRLTMP